MEPIALGKYELIKKIAHGGMAEIYVAKVTGLPGFEKIVVVKRILPQLATNGEFVQMFLDEARIAATLHHPNIVQMYDIGAVDGNYFISMEYLHGEDVRGLMKALRQKDMGLPLEHALNVIIGLSSGLHYAHEKKGFDGKPLGIVHRDVTPQNVFITYDGVPKIVDFGIAKATNRLNETRYGTLKGKIPYMSPEQCRSEPLDRRSDIYAIGIMLYELTTGYRLYKGASEFEILKKIVEGAVTPPSQVRQGYPKELEEIVMKALAKNKAERYQTAQDLQADLEAFAREHRLVISSIALAAFMNRVFGEKIEAWREAQAAGADLAAHIAERHKSRPGPGDQETSDGSEVLDDDDDLEEVPESKISQTPSGAGEVRVPAAAAPTRKKWLLIVAVAAVLAVGAGAVVALKGGGGGAPGTQAAAATKEPQGGEPVRPAAPDDGAGASAQPDVPPPSPSPSPAVAAGLAKLSSRPEGATVHVDGVSWREPTPTVVDGLTPGEHTFRFELKGYQEKVVKAVVVANETAVVPEVVLERAGGDRDGDRGGPRVAKGESKPPPGDSTKTPPPDTKPPPEEKPTAPAGEGEVRIATVPSCEVIINGKARGSTPIVGLMLPAGTHKVQVINSRYGIDSTYTVQVRAGEVNKFRWTFQVDPN